MRKTDHLEKHWTGDMSDRSCWQFRENKNRDN